MWNLMLAGFCAMVSPKGPSALCSKPVYRADSLPAEVQNRPPLAPRAYLELPLGSIRARGWLLDQLQRMENGMTGHLDSLYPQVLGSRNGWLGGNGDVWERGPYWLDGLLPLAYILHDSSLEAKVQPWITWTLNSQRPDGYFGPEPHSHPPKPEPGLQRDLPEDWWPHMVMLKVLQQYYEATADPRVLPFLTRYFHYQLRTLPSHPLDYWSWWGQQRGGDNLMVVYWLYDRTGDTSLLRLADLLYNQTYDWTYAFAHTSALSQLYRFHGVNLAQGIKEPLEYFQQHPDLRYLAAVQDAFRDIRMYQEQPEGVFGADELTHGNDPTQGSEFCSAVELMFSLEEMQQISGQVSFMDRLERIAYNALPTQATDDFSARQYFQQANQVQISRQPHRFVTPYDGTALCYGLLTGYPCCTCNMHQGWPKFVQNLWYRSSDGGVAALVYGPSELDIPWAGGKRFRMREQTHYPFSDTIRFIYLGDAGLSVPLHLRIPAWCDTARILAQGRFLRSVAGDRIIRVNRSWNPGDTLTLVLPMHVRLAQYAPGSLSVERGPLVYVLRIPGRWKHVPARDAYGSYWEVYPRSAWNYGLPDLPSSGWKDAFQVRVRPWSGAYPWNLKNCPIELRTQVRLLPQWHLYNGSAGPLPVSARSSDPWTEVRLVPYGCSTLRVSEFPVLRP